MLMGNCKGGLQIGPAAKQVGRDEHLGSWRYGLPQLVQPGRHGCKININGNRDKSKLVDDFDHRTHIQCGKNNLIARLQTKRLEQKVKAGADRVNSNATLVGRKIRLNLAQLGLPVQVSVGCGKAFRKVAISNFKLRSHPHLDTIQSHNPQKLRQRPKML
jgi:hypothetical protein